MSKEPPFRSKEFSQASNKQTPPQPPPPRAPLVPCYSGSGNAKCGSRSRIHCPPMRVRSSFSSEARTSIIAPLLVFTRKRRGFFFAASLCTVYTVASQGGSCKPQWRTGKHFPLLRFLRGKGAPKRAGGRRGAGTEDQASRKERR